MNNVASFVMNVINYLLNRLSLKKETVEKTKKKSCLPFEKCMRLIHPFPHFGINLLKEKRPHNVTVAKKLRTNGLEWGDDTGIKLNAI